MTESLQPFLLATAFIESDAPAVRALADSLQRDDTRATAIALFNWVRDEVRYDPYCATDPRDQYLASAILARRRGYCVQKAVLLAALGRAAGIPTRLGFADVRNLRTPAKLRRAMGTDVYLFHGYVELFLGARWVKATPAFDPIAQQRAGLLPVELDGEHDATLHPVDPRGDPAIEYLRDRGHFADLPFEVMQAEFAAFYGPLIDASVWAGLREGRAKP